MFVSGDLLLPTLSAGVQTDSHDILIFMFTDFARVS